MEKTTAEEIEKLLKLEKNDDSALEEDFTKMCRPWTRDFANLIQLFQIITEGLDFDKEFRIVIDYNPKFKRTAIRRYVNRDDSQSYHSEEKCPQ